jgi:hypothetical protein
MTNHDAIQLNAAFNKSTASLAGKAAPSTLLGKQMIDPHSPLALHSSKLFETLFQSYNHINAASEDNRLLVFDLLSVHLIRNINGSTIISFHPSLNLPTTTAPFLHERIRFAGELISSTLLLLC